MIFACYSQLSGIEIQRLNTAAQKSAAGFNQKLVKFSP
jgi:hypothetical protein